MALATIPDAERLVSDYLRAHADIVALGARIVGKSPGNTSTAWVRVTDLDSPQVNQPDHLVEFMLQFDCYAGSTGGQPEANSLARAVRAVLGTLPGSHALGTVTGVRVLGGPRGLDTDLEPARDYRIVTALVWMHA